MSAQSVVLSRVFADVAATRPLRPRVPVLAYRSLDGRGTALSTAPETFRWQMRRLATGGWHTLGVDALLGGHAAGGWPERSFVLTFDGGYRNFREQALKLLHSYGFGALVFVAADYVGRADARRPARMDWSDLRAAADAGMQIGLQAAAESEHEIVTGKQALETRLEQAVTAFAYACGAGNTDREQIVARHFRAGFGTRLGYASPQSRVARFERIDVRFLRSAGLFGALNGNWLGVYLRARQSLRDLRARA